MSTMCFSHFTDFFHHFKLEKIVTSSKRVKHKWVKILFCLHLYYSVGQKKAQSKVTVKSLQQHHLKGNSEKMSTMKIHEMLPEDKKRIQELKETKASEKSKAL